MIEITVYRGLDTSGIITERLVKDLVIMLRREYELDLSFSVIDVPIIEDARLPKVSINGKVIVEGRIPGIDELVDAVFNTLKENIELGPAGFPIPIAFSSV